MTSPAPVWTRRTVSLWYDQLWGLCWVDEEYRYECYRKIHSRWDTWPAVEGFWFW